jgi:hypothetical protein
VIKLDEFLPALERNIDQSEIRLGMAWLDDNDDARVQVSPLSKPLQEDARKILTRTVRQLTRNDDQPFTPGGDIRRGSFGRMQLNAASASGLLHGGLPNALARLQNFAEPAPIGLTAVHDETPSFYAFVCYTPDEYVVLFGRRLNPSKFARRGTIRFVVGDEATLKKFDKELVVIDNQVDWLFAGDEFLVLKPDQLESAFIDPARLLAETETNASFINAKVPIENFGDFLQRCIDIPGMQTRLARIVSSPEWQAWTPDETSLKDYSARYGGVVDWDPASGKLKFDGLPKRQWNILKLLDQAFYTGELTQTQYEATGKQVV